MGSKANGLNRFPIEKIFEEMSPNSVSQMDVLNAKIRYYAPEGKPAEDFLLSEIQNWKNSKEYDFLKTAERYYENENDINNFVRYTFNGRGSKVKSKLSNTKRSHAFFRDLVDQRVRYLLTKPFSLKTEDTPEGSAYNDALEGYFTSEFRRRFKNLGKSSTIDGLAWLQVSYSTNGELVFTRVPRREIIPFWADADHTILDAVIRFYDVTIYTGSENVMITKVQFHTKDGVWYYQVDEKGIHEDKDREFVHEPHFWAQKPNEGNDSDKVKTDGEDILIDESGNETRVGMVWDRVPFVAFKASADELSLLKLVKGLIDEYDSQSSNLGNLLKDVPESIKVVTNYDGTDPVEFLQKLSDYRTAFIREGGSLSTISDPINIAGTYQDLEAIRKNIYHFGNGVDYSVQTLGNSTGVGLKFLYGKLASAADDMADEFQAAFEYLLWFVNQDILLKTGVDFTGQKATLVFNTDMIINESETIDNAVKSRGIISNKTIVENHPWVTDPDQELEAVDKQNDAEMQAMIKNYGLPGVDDTPPDGSEGGEE